MKRVFIIVCVCIACTNATYVFAATQTLRINEIMYNPPGEISGGKNLEWVELYNPGPTNVTLIGGVTENAWTISDSAGTHYFAKTTYQGSMVIAPHA